MSLTIHASNYRVLREVAWTIPAGLSVVVGANGAGKTTLLFIADLLRRAVDQGSTGLGAAVEEYGGGAFLRNAYAAPDAPIVLGVDVDGVSWSIESVPRGPGIAESPAERLMVDGQVCFARAAGEAGVAWNGKTLSPGSRTVLRRLADLDMDGTFPGKKVLDALAGYRLQYDVDMRALRRGSPDGPHKVLHSSGFDAFSVLRNWRDWSGDAFRYAFVVDSLRECFGFFEKLDFQKGGATIEGYLVHRGGGRGSPPITPAGSAANGWLSALARFTAVASADPGDVVAIDELENSLHPRAVREALNQIQSYADWRGISVVLATQSTEVLNWFDGQPERVFVMDPRQLPSPKALTDMRSAEWLSHFRLGDKLAEGEFGADGAEA